MCVQWSPAALDFGIDPSLRFRFKPLNAPAVPVSSIDTSGVFAQCGDLVPGGFDL